MHHRSFFCLSLPLFFVCAQAWYGSAHDVHSLSTEEHKRIADIQAAICQTPDESSLIALSRRDTVRGSVGANVTLPQAGLSLGNITTKLGNINLTVTNVTIAVGNVNIENIEIGNVTVIVSVPLPGASPINAFSALTSAQSISTSSNTPTSTVSGGTTVTQTATTVVRRDKRDVTTVTVSPSGTDTSASVGASATVSSNPINLDTGNVYTEIGNITIEVGHVNVSIGDVTIKNVTIGNIFVLVQIGQPDLAWISSNLTGAAGNLLPAS